MFDALVILVGCDKTIPGAAMALARLDIPGLVLYGGSIAPGRWQGKDVTIQDVFEAVGAFDCGQARRGGVRGARERRVPWRRRLRRPVHGQHDGHRLRVPRAVAVRQRDGPGDGCRQRTTCRGRPARSSSTCCSAASGRGRF